MARYITAQGQFIPHQHNCPLPLWPRGYMTLRMPLASKLCGHDGGMARRRGHWVRAGQRSHESPGQATESRLKERPIDRLNRLNFGQQGTLQAKIFVTGLYPWHLATSNHWGPRTSSQQFELGPIKGCSWPGFQYWALTGPGTHIWPLWVSDWYVCSANRARSASSLLRQTNLCLLRSLPSAASSPLPPRAIPLFTAQKPTLPIYNRSNSVKESLKVWLFHRWFA